MGPPRTARAAAGVLAALCALWPALLTEAGFIHPPHALTVVRHAPPAVPPYSTQINVYRWLAAFPPPVLHRALFLAHSHPFPVSPPLPVLPASPPVAHPIPVSPPITHPLPHHLPTFPHHLPPIAHHLPISPSILQHLPLSPSILHQLPAPHAVPLPTPTHLLPEPSLPGPHIPVLPASGYFPPRGIFFQGSNPAFLGLRPFFPAPPPALAPGPGFFIPTSTRTSSPSSPPQAFPTTPPEQPAPLPNNPAGLTFQDVLNQNLNLHRHEAHGLGHYRQYLPPGGLTRASSGDIEL